jgi:hypothetical protein
MAHEAGYHPQIYCKSRFTHRLCTGYRSENANTLNSAFGIQFPESNGIIEIFCSCSCHVALDLLTEDPLRYDSAFDWTEWLDRETAGRQNQSSDLTDKQSIPDMSGSADRRTTFCSNCGKQASQASANFCISCGTRLIK